MLLNTVQTRLLKLSKGGGGAADSPHFVSVSDIRSLDMVAKSKGGGKKIVGLSKCHVTQGQLTGFYSIASKN